MTQHDIILGNQEFIKAKLNDAKVSRTKKQIDDALLKLDEIEGHLHKLGEADYLDVWGKYYYERGMILDMTGDIDRSVACFRKSAVFSKRDNNLFSERIGLFRECLTLYLGDKIAVQDAYNTMCELHDRHERETDDFEQKKSDDANLLNLRKRLCQIACDLGGNDFKRWQSAIYEHNFLKTEKPVARVAAFDLHITALKHVTEGDFKAAMSLFAAYLEYKGDGLPASDHEIRPDVLEFYRNISEEVCRDYYYFGHAVLMSDLPHKKDIAHKIWKKAQTVDTSRTTPQYLGRIEKALHALEKEAAPV